MEAPASETASLVPGAAAKDRTQLWAAADWVLIGAGLFVQIYFVLKGIWGDGSYRFNYLTQLLDQHTLSDFYYSYVGPIWALPLVVIDRWLKDDYWLTARYNVFVFVAGAIAVWFALRKSVDRATLRAFFVLLIAASMFPFHISTFYAETFSAVTIGVGLILVQRTRWAWLLMGLGVMNQPANVVPLGMVALYFAWKQKRLLPLIATFCAGLGVILENWIRRGDPLVSGYANGTSFPLQVMPFGGTVGFTYPFLFGLLALTFSFGRGLAFYAPGLWLSFAKRQSQSEQEYWVTPWLIFTAGLVLVYAKWWCWHGAAYWGPRYHLFAALPATWLLAHFVTQQKEERLHPAITLLFLTLSVWVSIDGIAFNFFKGLDKLPACNMADGALCMFAPEFSPLLYPLINTPALGNNDTTHIAFCLIAFVRYAAPLCVATARRVLAALPAREAFAINSWRI